MRLFTLVLLLCVSIITNAQKRILLPCDSGSESFTVSFNHDQLRPGSKALYISIESSNTSIQTFRYFSSDLSEYLLKIDNSKEWIFTMSYEAPKFKTTDSKKLILIPVYAPNTPDSIKTCSKLTIDIPIKKNKAPAKENELEIPVVIGSEKYSRKFDGKQLISDEFDDPKGQWFLNKHDPQFTINQKTGEISFDYQGQPEKLKKKYSMEVTYRDWQNEKATSKIVLNVTEKVEPAVLKEVDFRHVSFYEGIEKKYGRIFAKKNDKEVPVKVIGYMDGNRRVTNDTYKSIINKDGEFVWSSTNYDIITDEYRSNKEIVFIVKPNDARAEETTLTITLHNRTKPAAQNMIKEALDIFDDANKSFYKNIKKPSCIIARSITWLERGDYDLGSFKSTYDAISSSAGSLGVPTESLVPIAKIGFEVADKLKKDKKERVQGIIGKWENATKDIIKTANQLKTEIEKALYLNFTANYTTIDSAKSLKQKVELYKNAVENLNNNDNINIETITSFLPKSRRGDVESKCQ